MSKEFKAGDLVYCPQLDQCVFTVQPSQRYPTHLFKICRDDSLAWFLTAEGKLYEFHEAAIIFHATHENQRILEQLHGIKLEDAPDKPTSRDIVKSRLAKGEKFVPCYAHWNIVDPNHLCFRVYIQGIHEDGRFIDDNHELWEHVTPFDPVTDEPITELA